MIPTSVIDSSGGCVQGTCAPSTDACECHTAKDCEPRHAEAVKLLGLCAPDYYCDTNPAAFVCKPLVVSQVTCLAHLDTTCAKSACDPKTGTCKMPPAGPGVGCDDGKNTTSNDTCEAGQCVGEQIGCVSSADCADAGNGNLCEGTYYCDKSLTKPVCKVNAATVVNCQSVDDTQARKTAAHHRLASAALWRCPTPRPATTTAAPAPPRTTVRRGSARGWLS